MGNLIVTDLSVKPISVKGIKHIRKLQNKALKDCAEVANNALSVQAQIAMSIPN